MCCACADVSDFKNRSVKIFLLKICSEYQNLVEKLEAIYCVECVQIRSFFWSVFSRIRTEYGEIRSNDCDPLFHNVEKCVWPFFNIMK